MSPSGQAHDVLGTFVQHGAHLTVGAQHIDITLDLTFFEEWSARERGVMDADASGNITKSERESYAKKLAPQLYKQVKLRVAGRELPLVPLYDPEVDLLANNKVGPANELGLVMGVVTAKSWHVADHPEKVLDEKNAYTFGKFLGERYQNNAVIWFPGGDSAPGKYDAVWVAVAKGLKNGSGGSQLVCYHGQGSTSINGNR